MLVVPPSSQSLPYTQTKGLSKIEGQESLFKSSQQSTRQIVKSREVTSQSQLKARRDGDSNHVGGFFALNYPNEAQSVESKNRQLGQSSVSHSYPTANYFEIPIIEGNEGMRLRGV
ncbi:hypothetical protein Tco_1276759 [Tanacetum coccineum]